METIADHKKAAEKHVLYEKNPATKIATITFDRLDKHNTATIGMRARFAELVFRANIDDEVKVLVIRGAGDNLGSGGDLDEHGDLYLNPQPGDSFLVDLEIEDPDVKYPPPGSFRYLHGLTDYYAKARSGNRPLQEFKKISIIEAKGYCYGWHFYQCADADLVVSSDDALFGHPSFRYAGWGPRLWQWADMMGPRKFMEMLFTGRPFTAQDMYDCNFINSVVQRDRLEEETAKYAHACSITRPNDTVVVQKTFMELYKQYRGEYMGSLLTGFVEGMLPAMTDDGDADVNLGKGSTFKQGIGKVVKNNDLNYPADWRLSKRGRGNH
ncbi:enoyl-CoA hydratase/isomerase family protein [Novosphingobium album (ex Liu et al. 2023)]|uniref:Enoyl-CoA hydratase/isomerase family protein n=1 Tax=Novosphingobium album (ex Liu et al. 2023) TaxID=3031130 RepID=A0ABT5WUH9_9SPHN|nr:enoyl-CoA hydratase/isomerase family protein [Novosphingobium album (ex Liu et al. 2023)]MDE8653513.1 enoyl-CoA hydratase/isomerase family protein [Novosphingobium album (ex Liu et al. 2023)]